MKKQLLQSLLYPFFKFLPDKNLMHLKFKWHQGYRLSLDEPKSLNEKINWLKLHDRTPLHTQCADKYRVRTYVSDKIGAPYLVPLYLQTENPLDINKDSLKDFLPCIIKANHDSSGGIFVHDLDQDWEAIQSQLAHRLTTNYYPYSREWQYKNIEPCIIVEQLLQDKKGNIPFDYKVHCFNGKVRMIQVDMGRGTAAHYRNWYTADWEREPYKWSSPKGDGQYTDPRDTDIEKPDCLEDMKVLSEKLAVAFDYVRVDWYDVDGKLYFGELTFHHDGGYSPIRPREWDFKLGSELIISSK